MEMQIIIRPGKFVDLTRLYCDHHTLSETPVMACHTPFRNQLLYMQQWSRVVGILSRLGTTTVYDTHGGTLVTVDVF